MEIEKLVELLIKENKNTAIELATKLQNPNVTKDIQTARQLLKDQLLYSQIQAVSKVISIYRSFSPLPFTPNFDSIITFLVLLEEELKKV